MGDAQKICKCPKKICGKMLSLTSNQEIHISIKHCPFDQISKMYNYHRVLLIKVCAGPPQPPGIHPSLFWKVHPPARSHFSALQPRREVELLCSVFPSFPATAHGENCSSVLSWAPRGSLCCPHCLVRDRPIRHFPVGLQSGTERTASVPL